MYSVLLNFIGRRKAIRRKCPESFLEAMIMKTKQDRPEHRSPVLRPQRATAALCSVVFGSLRPCGLSETQAPLSVGFPWDFPGKKEILLTQGSNLHLLHFLHWQADSLPLTPPGEPSIANVLPYLS